LYARDLRRWAIRADEAMVLEGLDLLAAAVPSSWKNALSSWVELNAVEINEVTDSSADVRRRTSRLSPRIARNPCNRVLSPSGGGPSLRPELVDLRERGYQHDALWSCHVPWSVIAQESEEGGALGRRQGRPMGCPACPTSCRPGSVSDWHWLKPAPRAGVPGQRLLLGFCRSAGATRRACQDNGFGTPVDPPVTFRSLTWTRWPLPKTR